jgi:hypothetical protein
MIGLITVAVVLVISLVALSFAQLHRRRVEARRFQWQFGTYQGGRLVHAVPLDDIDHVEDHPADCVCSPWSERFERGDGSYGSVIYHQRVRR